jgi:hypothetical protein
LFLVAGLQGIITERADIGTPEARNEKQDTRNQKPVTSCQLLVSGYNPKSSTSTPALRKNSTPERSLYSLA